MGRKRSINYVDNNELKELVTDYIISNPNDDGAWVEKYERTMITKYKGKNDKRFQSAMNFIQFRKELYAHERPFGKYEETCNKLIPILYKIIDGRMASYHIFDNEDIRQECMLALLKYLNRFDFRLKTSAFAYISEIITQAINLYLQEEKKDYLDGLLIPENQLFDFRTVDQMLGGDSGEEEYDA